MEFANNDTIIKYSGEYAYVLKWDSYIGYWTCCIGHKNYDHVQKIKTQFKLSNYHFDDQSNPDPKFYYVCFDTLQNLDRNVGPDGEEGWCCYKNKDQETHLCSKNDLLKEMQQMVQQFKQ
jgi:hypothetical protein